MGACLKSPQVDMTNPRPPVRQALNLRDFFVSAGADRELRSPSQALDHRIRPETHAQQ